MKSRICLMMIVMLAGSTYAQQAHVGIKGGVNFNNIYYEPHATYQSKTGFHAGLLWHLHVSRHFAFQPEVVYSLQGATLPDHSKLNLGYLNVPFLIQFMFNNGLRLEAGPQVGFLVHANSASGGTQRMLKAILERLMLGWPLALDSLAHLVWVLMCVATMACVRSMLPAPMRLPTGAFKWVCSTSFIIDEWKMSGTRCKRAPTWAFKLVYFTSFIIDEFCDVSRRDHIGGHTKEVGARSPRGGRLR